MACRNWTKNDCDRSRPSIIESWAKLLRSDSKLVVQAAGRRPHHRRQFRTPPGSVGSPGTGGTKAGRSYSRESPIVIEDPSRLDDHWLRDRVRLIVNRLLPGYDGRVQYLTVVGDHHQATVTITARAIYATELVKRIEEDRKLRISQVSGDTNDTSITVVPR